MRRVTHSRPALVAIGIAALLLIVSFTVPAFAGRTAFQSLSTKKTAKKALRVARDANSRSARAIRIANQHRGRTGKTGKTGKTGAKGSTGAKGDVGPTASSSASAGSHSLGPTPDDMMSTEIQTSFQGRLLANASAQIAGTGTVVCWLNTGDGSSGSDISQRMEYEIAVRESVSVTGATIRNAGTTPIRLYCQETSGDVTFDQGNLNVVAAAA